MARVLVAAQTTPGSYPTLQPTANSLDLTFQVCDPSLKNYTPLVEGKTVLLARNLHATDPKTVTVTSVTDAQKRVGDITAYSIGAGEVAIILGPTKKAGWESPTGGGTPAGLWFEGSTTDIAFAVLTLP